MDNHDDAVVVHVAEDYVCVSLRIKSGILPFRLTGLTLEEGTGPTGSAGSLLAYDRPAPSVMLCSGGLLW